MGKTAYQMENNKNMRGQYLANFFAIMTIIICGITIIYALSNMR